MPGLRLRGPQAEAAVYGRHRHVDPLPHQIEAVYHYALQSPRIRFLIADDAGAGKTIMAGLIFKELEYRRLARRVRTSFRRVTSTPCPSG